MYYHLTAMGFYCDKIPGRLIAAPTFSIGKQVDKPEFIFFPGGTSAAKAFGCAAGSGGSVGVGYVQIEDHFPWRHTSLAAGAPDGSCAAETMP